MGKTFILDRHQPEIEYSEDSLEFVVNAIDSILTSTAQHLFNEETRIAEIRQYNGIDYDVVFVVDSPYAQLVLDYDMRAPEVQDGPPYEEYVPYRMCQATFMQFLDSGGFEVYIVPTSIEHTLQYMSKILKSSPGSFLDITRETARDMLRNLGVGIKRDVSFVIVDIETERESNRFQVGCTWDPYHLSRVFFDKAALAEYLEQFQKIITYNGEKHDLKHLFGGDIPLEKSVDLYRIFSQALKYQRGYFHEEGELTLANLALANFKAHKWEFYTKKHVRNREIPFTGSGKSLEDHCKRDVQLTKMLFFQTLRRGSIRYVSKRGIDQGYFLEGFPLGNIVQDAINYDETMPVRKEDVFWKREL